jgi:hypothetical protein
MITTDKFIEIFCIAGDFCKAYEQEIQKYLLEDDPKEKKRNRKTQMSPAEMITIMVCFHSGSFRNFKHYYLFFICDYMKSYFPNALSYNRFVELQPCLIVPFLLFLKPGAS